MNTQQISSDLAAWAEARRNSQSKTRKEVVREVVRQFKQDGENTEIRTLLQALEYAWTIIRNVEGGDWSRQSTDWISKAKMVGEDVRTARKRNEMPKELSEMTYNEMLVVAHKLPKQGMWFIDVDRDIERYRETCAPAFTACNKDGLEVRFEHDSMKLALKRAIECCQNGNKGSLVITMPRGSRQVTVKN